MMQVRLGFTALETKPSVKLKDVDSGMMQCFEASDYIASFSPVKFKKRFQALQLYSTNLAEAILLLLQTVREQPDLSPCIFAVL